MTKKCGRMSAIGISSKKTKHFPWNVAMSKCIDIYFNYSSSYTAWDRALLILAKCQEQLLNVISHKVKLEEWETVFNDLVEEKGIKALFIP